MSDKVASNLVAFGFWALMGMIVWPVIMTIGPRIEGSIFPVVTRTHISRIVEADGGVTIWGQSDKARDCVYMGVEWYYTSEKNSVLVPIEFKEGVKVRSPGWLNFGPWGLPLTREQLLTSSFAVVKHRCHVLWLTETPFWP